MYTLDSLRELLLWLNDWPGGVKLNYELAKIFCDGFLWGTGVWEEGVSPSSSLMNILTRRLYSGVHTSSTVPPCARVHSRNDWILRDDNVLLLRL